MSSPRSSNFGGKVRAVLCTAGSGLGKVWSQVKCSSLDNSMPSWKDGRLHVAENIAGKYVLVAEFRNALPKFFTVTGNIKKMTHLSSNMQRLVIGLRDGANIHITKASPSALQALCKTIEAIEKGNAQSSKAAQRALPWSHEESQSPLQAVTSPKEHRATPRTPSQSENSALASVKSRTPTPRSKILSPRRPGKRKSPDDEVACVEEVDNDENLGVSMLFTDQMDKENQYTPSIKNRESVFQMRKREGGSMFMESFEEKQKHLEESRKKGINAAAAVSTNFYNTKRGPTNYSGSALFSVTTPRTNAHKEDSGKKKTPGYLESRSSGNLKPKSIWGPWNKTSSLQASQRHLQGFSNLGNTCYMNAILQSLLGLQCFIQDLENLDLIRAVPKASLYRALSRLLYAKQNRKDSAEIGFRLRMVKAAISATATRFSGFMQHDAHEFLCQCLDQLKEDVEQVNNPKTEKQPVREANDSVSPADKMVSAEQRGSSAKLVCAVSQNLELEVVHSILCQECGEEVTKTETFNDLSLDLPRTSEPFSLQTALDTFFSSEKLEYACAKCDCKESLITHKFTKLPRVLVLHLKRYTFDAEALADGKLRMNVRIPRFLTLAWHTTKDTAPPPARSRAVPATNVMLSPLRDSLKTPSNQGSPDHSEGRSRSSSELDFENSRSGFKFNSKRIRMLSDSPQKESKHFISRYEDDLPSDNNVTSKSSDQKLREMDEEQQLALAIELSRQEAEVHAAKQLMGGQGEINDLYGGVNKLCNEVTDSELTQAYEELSKANGDGSCPEKQEQSGMVAKTMDDDDDTDEEGELPVGLYDDREVVFRNKEEEELKQALQLSRESLQDEITRRGERPQGGDAENREPVLLDISDRVPAHLLKGNRTGGKMQGQDEAGDFNSRDGGGRGGFDEVDADGAETIPNFEGAAERRIAVGGAGASGRVGLLGGAAQGPATHPSRSTDEEPMDTDNDQPLAFSLDTAEQVDNPGQPEMWDAKQPNRCPELKRVIERELSRTSPNKIQCKMMSKGREHVMESDSSRTGVWEGGDSKKADQRTVKVDIQASESGGLKMGSSERSRHHDSSDSDVDDAASVPQISRGVERTSHTGQPLEGAKADGPSNDCLEEDGALWKPNKRCKKNIFQRPWDDASDSDQGAQDKEDSGVEADPLAVPMRDKDSVDVRIESAGEDGWKDSGKMQTLRYEEAKAKEEEEIRIATELSIKEAKEMSEKEAAEILRAQEMSLQDFEQRSPTLPARLKDGQGHCGKAREYTDQEAQMLAKHSEEGNMGSAYRLVSIVSHIGSSSMTGHYVSDVYDQEKRCWLSYDDSTVMRREESKLREERQRTGYIFFYQAKEFL